jgi:hypothetical protein
VRDYRASPIWPKLSPSQRRAIMRRLRITLRETLEKSAELDRFLVRSIRMTGVPMPELGGKTLADQVRVGLAGLRQQLNELKLDAAGALTELTAEIQNGKEGVKRIRAETAAVKAAFAEILGNERAETKGQ